MLRVLVRGSSDQVHTCSNSRITKAISVARWQARCKHAFGSLGTSLLSCLDWDTCGEVARLRGSSLQALRHKIRAEKMLA